MTKDAIISPCGVYRYVLTRTWGEGHTINFIMLNPSTADAENDDPTIRRCIGFAESCGYGGIIVTNLFAFRATNPKELGKNPNNRRVIGPSNDYWIARKATEAAIVVAAWGATHVQGRDREVLRFLKEDEMVNVHALKLTAGGKPSHPLRLPASCRPFSI